MECRSDFSLRPYNTFGVEAAAAGYVRFDEVDEIPAWLERHAGDGRRRLVIGGGSNLLLVDDFDGVVLHPLLKGIEVVSADRRHVLVRAMAGENWDDLVAHAVENGWGGIENLSLIPGSVGASAVQNIGAYGMEAKAVIERVEAIALDSAETASFSGADCGFAYRFSHFKGAWRGRYIVTAVVFRLSRRPDLVLDYPGVGE
ncbi:MAG TPA: FAD-binding protein, partial [Desulfosarcina sp.]|nr:FAD-binding protein [Desulfosarcina sp.]